MSQAKQNDTPSRKKERKNPGRGPVFARDPLYLCQLPQKHAVPTGLSKVRWRCCVLSGLYSRCDAPCCRRPALARFPCHIPALVLVSLSLCVCVCVCVNVSRAHTVCCTWYGPAVEVVVQVRQRGRNLLAPPIVLLPPFICQPQHGGPSRALRLSHTHSTLDLSLLR